MQPKLRILLLILLLIIVVISLGPVVDTNQTIRPVQVPADVDNYIQQREHTIPDIIPGAEKIIRWAHPAQRDKTRFALVYLHGFSATRQEMAPLCDVIAKRLDANIYYTRLTGHGRGSAAMGIVTVNALLNDAYEALQIGEVLGEQVIVIGASTGGSLATWLASQKRSTKIFAMILVSPNFGPKRSESELMLLPWGNLILELVEGDTYSFTPRNNQQQQFWTTQYPSRALLTMMGLVKVARESAANNITIPTLILYDKQDNIVDVNKTLKYAASFSSPLSQVIAITGSGDTQHHILAGDILSPQTTTVLASDIETFIDSLH